MLINDQALFVILLPTGGGEWHWCYRETIVNNINFVWKGWATITLKFHEQFMLAFSLMQEIDDGWMDHHIDLRTHVDQTLFNTQKVSLYIKDIYNVYRM